MSGQFNDILRELESWYRRDRGQYLLSRLRAELSPFLDNAFGYHILQIGPLQGEPLFGDCRIHHRVQACNRPGSDIGLVCESGEIPLESDSVDVILAHHSLEFVANPHQVLRELQRVLTPQGQLLLIGFNPYSLRGVVTRVRGLSRKSPWHGHFPVSNSRLADWLHLLNFELCEHAHVYAVPPVGSGRVRRMTESLDNWCQQHRLPIGGLYLQRAIKQVAAQNRPRSRLRRHGEKLIDLAVPRPGVAPTPAPNAPTRTPGAAARRATGELLH
ncbi:methyltransferase domain-containing protein [Seongchinamella sediminis]|uniref:Methyltransferase domain-containing protein n=1 Tax=Seongchinamella sediminis TaxID=2283635 RepID=A0A3L7E3P4_9GAMM|nr:methyltransferase domain-containing protein [Seongchinamella sediminis]RLQ22952.1 methyltransferase domain-containing protein [Seongchinamella sediminis]